MDDKKIIGIIPKNNSERITCSHSEYKGTNFIDLRIQFDMDGKWINTKKGIALTEQTIGQVIEVLNRAKEKLKN